MLTESQLKPLKDTSFYAVRIGEGRHGPNIAKFYVKEFSYRKARLGNGINTEDMSAHVWFAEDDYASALAYYDEMRKQWVASKSKEITQKIVDLHAEYDWWVFWLQDPLPEEDQLFHEGRPFKKMTPEELANLI